MNILSKLAKVVPAGWRSQVLETLKRQYGLGWPIALTSHPGSELDLLDVVLAHYANQNRRTRFLQVGAADGVMGDPLFPLIEQYSMEGVLIEPRRETYERLKENYARRFRKGFVFVNAAIMRSDGTQNFYSIKPDAEGPIGWRERPASTRASCFKRFDSLAILSR